MLTAAAQEVVHTRQEPRSKAAEAAEGRSTARAAEPAEEPVRKRSLRYVGERNGLEAGPRKLGVHHHPPRRMLRGRWRPLPAPGEAAQRLDVVAAGFG